PTAAPPPRPTSSCQSACPPPIGSGSDQLRPSPVIRCPTPERDARDMIRSRRPPPDHDPAHNRRGYAPLKSPGPPAGHTGPDGPQPPAQKPPPDPMPRPTSVPVDPPPTPRGGTALPAPPRTDGTSTAVPAATSAETPTPAV